MSGPKSEGVQVSTEDVRKVAFGSLPSWLAFGFGSGLSPVAPGTVGTLVAIPFIFALRSLGDVGFWVSLVILFLLGVWFCDHASKKLGVHDHGGIVWDEMVGYWLTVAFVPLQWQWLLAGFVLFRVFDILKPWPIRALDEKVSGGWGIMIDDMVAALFAMLLLALASRLL